MPPGLADGLAQVRGLGQLGIDGVMGTLAVVEGAHRAVLRSPGLASLPAIGPITRLTYGAICGVAGLVGRAVGTGLGLAETLARPRSRGHQPGYAEVVSRAALNGVCGDHLERTGNPLAIEMSLHGKSADGGRRIDLGSASLAGAVPGARSRILVLVHGLCMSDLQWRPRGESGAHGSESPLGRLGDELGWTTLALRYNSGRRVSTNGEQLAGCLEGLIAQWPVPVEELAIIGHSAGGLVARSACHHAAAAGLAGPGLLRRLVFIATPHHGAPLERVGRWVDRLLALSAYSAPFARLGMLRSAGIADLGFGNLVADDWVGDRRSTLPRDRRRIVPLPDGVRCLAIAATLDRGGQLVGDGLVPLDSALGRHRDPARDLALESTGRVVLEGVGHLAAVCDPRVIEHVGHWLGSAPRPQLSRAQPRGHGRSDGVPSVGRSRPRPGR